MIKITQFEADTIMRNVKHPKFSIASRRKRHGGKTYYIRNDDIRSLSVLASIRGFLNRFELIIWDRLHSL